MESIRIKELAKYCDSIDIDCSVCKKKDACMSFEERIEDISPIGIVELVNSNSEIVF